ncbi:MAG: GTP diphosphokinase [Gammaproteobacteria bacterium]|nr:GTP diphosphokinase [Gammaproteobacteria bacterium]MCF6230889.1 GTP diphosphokinase [Gammaproteobacteria bacterium]
MVSRATSELGIDGKHPFDLEGWLAHVHNGRNTSEMASIRRAYEVADNAHSGQTRASGIPYILHCVAVADILADLRMDSNTIIAALLHDTIEDTAITLNDLHEQFGEDVATLVASVTKMRRLPGWRNDEPLPDKQHLYAENLRKMVLAMAEDVRVVLIKLADRTHNMRTLGALSKERRQRIARETLEIVAPLANRLGIWQVKWELEDLALKYLDPESYHYIASKLDERRIERLEYIDTFVNTLKEHLAQAGIKAMVKGRPKHLYSIWRKMTRKQLEFENIFDVRAVRVVVEEVSQCYSALGIVHSLWSYVPGEFDDYIATPKGNNYRSLHTAVMGSEGKTVEVQIRTQDMDHHAEYGVAAHWRYKEGGKFEEGFNEKVAWLRQVLEWKEEAIDASDFIDQFKSDVLSDRVYVLTPKGRILDLPQGATPIDFAYAIHTDVGHGCRGAEVNGRIVSLGHQLQNGEQVKILNVKNGSPTRDWLNPHLGYIKTSRARSRILQWFKHQDFDKNVLEGRKLLERELGRLNVGGTNLEKLAKRMKFEQLDSFMAAIARGDIKMGSVMNVLQASLHEHSDSLRDNFQQKSTPRKSSSGDILIHGVGDLLTHMANCCKPVPGDPIVGYITQGRGVTVHRRSCSNAMQLRSENSVRLIEVGWEGEASSTYPVDIKVIAFDRTGLLRDVLSVLTHDSVNILASKSHTNPDNLQVDMMLTIEINSLDQLSRVLTKISQLPNVQEAIRNKGK